ERNFVQKGLSEWLPFSSILGKQCDFEEIIFEENRRLDMNFNSCYKIRGEVESGYIVFSL
ncbi:MAG TPA: hypothetical protein PKY84_06355, partial [Thermosynergistes sp.]|nr:hypothetical protein [Thermosynergistes sp.]